MGRYEKVKKRHTPTIDHLPDPTKRDFVPKMVGEAVSDDEVLRAYAKKLAKMSLMEATNIIQHGTPQAKAAIISKFIPHIARAMESGDEDDEISSMRKEYYEMVDEMGIGKQDADPEVLKP